MRIDSSLPTISIIGAGNMAFRLSIALSDAGYNIETLYNRSAEKGEKIVKILKNGGQKTQYVDSPEKTLLSKVIIIAVSDDAIGQIVSSLGTPSEEHLIVHTSGATSIEELKPLEGNGSICGVLYPLMTLSKSKNINFEEIPFLLEASAPEGEEVLKQIADNLHSDYFFCDSLKRLRMHAAAVFSCNFINYILALSFEVSGNGQTLLLPTTLEMVRKSFLMTPDEVKTGPAVRGDIKTIEKHIKLLQDLGLKEEEEIYRLLTDKIIKRNNN